MVNTSGVHILPSLSLVFPVRVVPIISELWFSKFYNIYRLT